MDLFAKPSSDRLISNPDLFSRRTVSLDPSERSNRDRFTKNCSVNEGVAIDEETRLEKCPVTSDWRFVTVSQDAANKLKDNSCGVSSTVHTDPPNSTVDHSPWLCRVRSGSADQKQGPRRRRYGSLKLEDMGIKIPAQTNASVNGCKSVEDNKELFPVMTPKRCNSAYTSHSLNQASESLATSQSVVKDSKNPKCEIQFLPYVPPKGQGSCDDFETENIIQMRSRLEPSPSVFKCDDGFSSKSDSIPVSGISSTKSNSYMPSILSSISQSHVAVEHVVAPSENIPKDVFMDSSLQQLADDFIVNGSCDSAVGLRHILKKKDLNSGITVKESQSNLKGRDLESSSNKSCAIVEGDATSFRNISSSVGSCIGAVPEFRPMLDVNGCSSQEAVLMPSRSDLDKRGSCVQSASGIVTDAGYSMPKETTSFMNVSDVTDSSALPMTFLSKTDVSLKDLLLKTDLDEYDDIPKNQISFGSDSQKEMLSEAKEFFTCSVSKEHTDASLQDAKCAAGLKKSCNARNLQRPSYGMRLLITDCEILTSSLKSNVSVANLAGSCSLDVLRDCGGMVKITQGNAVIQDHTISTDSAASGEETAMLDARMSCDARNIQHISDNSAAKDSRKAKEWQADESKTSACAVLANVEDDKNVMQGPAISNEQYELLHGNLLNTEHYNQPTVSCDMHNERIVQELNVPSNTQPTVISERLNARYHDQGSDKTNTSDEDQEFILERLRSPTAGNIIGQEEGLPDDSPSSISSSKKTLVKRSFPCHVIASFATNNFDSKTSEGKALFLNSPVNVENVAVKSIVNDKSGLAENVKNKTDAEIKHTARVSILGSDDSDQLGIPQFVSCEFAGDLSPQGNKDMVVLSPSKQTRNVVSGSILSSFPAQEGSSSISLLSWLQQSNSTKGSFSCSARSGQYSSPIIPVAIHPQQSSLPGTQRAASDEVCSSLVGFGVAKSEGKSEDELDFTRSSGVSKAPKRGSVPAVSSTLGRTAAPGSSSSSRHATTTSTAATPVKKRHSLVAGSSGSPVCVDEDIFVKQFDQVTKINVFSPKELVERVTRIREALSDPNLDWSKRIDALKELRACFFAGVKDHPDFIQQLTSLELCFQMSVKDLRSQVVREACITIAFMSQELGKEFGRFAESVLPSLVSLIPNSAKIMASSATICIRFILQHTHFPRLIPIITGNHTSKSSVIRKQCCELLYQIVRTWPTHVLERHIAVLQDAIKRGIGDADSDARVFSRKAFWAFSEHFKGQADSLLMSLDISKQRQLIGEQQSNSSSNTSLNSIGRSLTSGSLSQRSYKTRSVSTERGPSTGTVRCSSALGQPIHRTYTESCAGADGGRPKQSSSAVDLVSLADNIAGLSTMSKVESPHTQHNYGSLRLNKRTSSFSKPAEQLARSCDEKTLSSSMKSARPRKASLTGRLATDPTTQSSSSTERSRSRTRVGISQSQPGSRSNSPAARLSYITHLQPDVVPSSHGATSRGKPKTGIPKSQGSSREGSPTRVYGRERRFSGHSGVVTKQRSRATGPQRVLLQGEDSEAAVADALHRPKGKGSGDTYDSDDAASETSSTCSDSSYWACGRQLTEDMSEIISCLSSGAWGDRRDGLLALQNLLNNNRTLTRSELKKVTDIFSRMFHDPHGKVFSVFMETLVDLVAIHHDDLIDWLYVLLTRLLSKTGADLLASVQAKVQKALEVVRSTFPSSNQFLLLSKFLIDQTQSPNLKVKVSMLMYLHGLIQLMNPSDFSNTSDIRLAVSRIITWTTEPKSVEVRKAAQAVLIALYSLNTPEFSVMLSVLPKTFQEGANRILQNRLRGSGQDGDLTPQRGVTSSVTPSSALFRYKMSPAGRLTRDGTEGGTLTTVDIYDSIRQTTNDIHKLIKDDARRETRDALHRASAAPASSILPSSAGSLTSPLTSESRVPTFLHNSTGKPRIKEEISSLEDQRFFSSNAYLEQENFALKMENHLGSDESYFSEEVKSEQGDMIQDILVELSNHNEREEERKSALLVLMKKAREEGTDVWDEYFNAVLLMLLETLGDNDGHIRALALRVLAEFLRCMPDRFQDYVELTTMRTLDAHKDPIKEVTRAAEECITLMARIVPPSRCHSFLKPLIECEDFPVNLAAIKMFTQVIEEHQKDDVIALLPDMIPGLLKGYENSQSSVRKASVVCLVAIYLCVGEALRPFLQDLHGSKVKLLNVYIKKALEDKGGGGGGESNSCTTSKASSPTSMVDA